MISLKKHLKKLPFLLNEDQTFELRRIIFSLIATFFLVETSAESLHRKVKFQSYVLMILEAIQSYRQDILASRFWSYL